MKNKKQKYLYVARCYYNYDKVFSFYKIRKLDMREYAKNGFFWSTIKALNPNKIPKYIRDIKVEKGQQIRIPLGEPEVVE